MRTIEDEHKRRRRQLFCVPKIFYFLVQVLFFVFLLVDTGFFSSPPLWSSILYCILLFLVGAAYILVSLRDPGYIRHNHFKLETEES